MMNEIKKQNQLKRIKKLHELTRVNPLSIVLKPLDKNDPIESKQNKSVMKLNYQSTQY